MYDSYSKERYQPFHLLVNFWEVNCKCIYMNVSLCIIRIGFFVVLVTSVSLAEERKWLPSSHGKWAASTFLQWELNSLEKFLGSVCVDCLQHWLSKAVPSNPYFIGEKKNTHGSVSDGTTDGTRTHFPVSLRVNSFVLQSLLVCRTLPGCTFPGTI